MNPDELYELYQDLQEYVGWSEEDAERVRSVAPILSSRLDQLIDDFYRELQRHKRRM